MIVSQKSPHLIKKLIFCLLILGLCACQDNKQSNSTQLIKGDKNLSPSMVEFYESFDIGHFDGQAFEAKFLEISQVESPTRTYVYYKIAIAPKTLDVEKINDVAFYPNQTIMDYYKETNEHSITKNQLPYVQYNNLIKRAEYPKVQDRKDYTAYVYDFVFDTLTSDIQKATISSTLWEDYIKDIHIEIQYNGKKTESFNLNGTKVNHYTSSTIPSNLKPLISDDPITTGMQPLKE